MGWEIVLFVISTLLTIALAPKPPQLTPAGLNDFTVPTADETRVIPWLFGTRLLTGPNVVGYGGLRVDAIHKASLFSSSTIGFKYYLVLDMVMCSGPIDHVGAIIAGGKLAWHGNVTSNTTVDIDKNALFGGETGGGGIQGSVDFLFGEPTQTPNAALAAVFGSIPAYRDVFSLVFHQLQKTTGPGFVGTQASLQPWAIHATRIHKGWPGGVEWYAAKSAISNQLTSPEYVGGADMNPAHIIYQVLTDPNQGLGVSTSDLNDANFRAIADQLYTEGTGISLLWQNSTQVDSFLQTVADHMGGGISLNPETGLYELMLFRGGYDPSTLPVFDQTNTKDLVNYQVTGWGDTVNEIVLVYTIPPGENSPQSLPTNNTSSITMQDIGNIASQGRIVQQTINYPGIRKDSLAQRTAARELATRCTPLAKITISVNRSAWNLTFGGLFKFNWPDAPAVTGKVFRALRVTKGPLGSDKLLIDAVQDIYSLDLANYIVGPTTTPTPGQPVYPSDPPAGGPSVISATTTAPPGSPASGDRYLVPAGATGAWSGHATQVAEWNDSTSPGKWIFFDVPVGTPIYVVSSGSYQTVIGGVIVAAPLSSLDVSAILSIQAYGA